VGRGEQDRGLELAQRAMKAERTARDPLHPDQAAITVQIIRKMFKHLGRLTNRETRILEVGWTAGHLAAGAFDFREALARTRRSSKLANDAKKAKRDRRRASFLAVLSREHTGSVSKTAAILSSTFALLGR
jgi:hypothetical protein